MPLPEKLKRKLLMSEKQMQLANAIADADRDRHADGGTDG